MKQNFYSIAAPLPKKMELDGKTYTLNLSFDRVICFYELFSGKNSAMSYEDKIDVAYSWLVSRPSKASPEEKLAAVHKINSDFLTMRHGEKKPPKPQRTAVNYIVDSRYIYAAFRQYYGINLFKERGRLTWWEFYAMFDSLPDDCKIKRIMDIRTKDIPAYNGHNQEEIALLMEQQEYYFLEENREELAQAANDSLDRIFAVLEKKAREV